MGSKEAMMLLERVRGLSSTMRWRRTGFGSLFAGAAILAALANGGGTILETPAAPAAIVAEATPTVESTSTPLALSMIYAQPQPDPGSVPSYVVRPEPTPEPTVERAEPSTRSSRPAPTTEQERFIFEHAPAAQASQVSTVVPASVTLAQAILESNCGKSQLATDAHNYFGIKARGAEGPAGVVNMNTWEHEGGRDVTRNEPFRAYNSAEESFTDHGQYLVENSRYAEAMKHTDDAKEFARLIHKAGYATDPEYSNKLIRLMDKYDLYEFDL